MPPFAFALAAITATLLLTLLGLRWWRWQKRQTLLVDCTVAARLAMADGAAIEFCRLPSAESPGFEPCQGRLPPVSLAAPAWVAVTSSCLPRWPHLGLARLLPAPWLSRIAAAASPLPSWVRHWLFGSPANARDVPPEVADRALANVTSDIPTPLLRDLPPGRASQLFGPGRDGQPLPEGLGQLNVRALLIAGADSP